MTLTLAFDIYGTLIDTHGVLSKLSSMVGDKASQFSVLWRNKQLEYSFRRGLMRSYKNFSVCTREALDYTDLTLQTKLGDDKKGELLSYYGQLPAFKDVGSTLNKLRARGIRCFAFSNGSEEAVKGLLESADLLPLMDGVVSVDDLQTFKPNPDVYRYLLEVADCKAEEIWLVSANSFDIIGGHEAGLRTIWLKRDPNAVYDPWGIEPTLVVNNLDEINTLIDSSTLLS